MKKLINPQPNGGVPLSNEYFLNLQDEAFNCLKQVLRGVGDFFVVYGCTVEAQDSVLKTCEISPGYVWIGNDIREFKGYTGTYPYFIKPDADTFEKLTLNDGSSKNVYVTKTCSATSSRPAQLPYVEGSPKPFWIFKEMITQTVTNNLNSEITTRQQQIQAESAARTNAVNQININLGRLSDSLATKATSKIPFTPWTDLPMAGIFTTGDSGFTTAQYMRTEDGFVHLRGRINVSAVGGQLNYLTSGHLPAASSLFFINGLGNYKVKVEASPLGLYATLIGATSGSFFLDGISFYADGSGGVI